MKRLTDIKNEVANDEGWSKWSSLAAPWVPSKDLEKHWEEVAKRYAQQCCEDLRERIAEEAKTKYIRYDNPKHNYYGEDVVDKYSIRNVEIILP